MKRVLEYNQEQHQDTWSTSYISLSALALITDQYNPVSAASLLYAAMSSLSIQPHISSVHAPQCPLVVI